MIAIKNVYTNLQSGLDSLSVAFKKELIIFILLYSLLILMLYLTLSGSNTLCYF